MPGFEIYLQFDSFEAHVLKELRGADLRRIRQQAIEHLNEFNISTTLVVTLKKGLNDSEIGDIIQYGLQQKAVRGVTIQPIQAAGRLEGYDPATDCTQRLWRHSANASKSRPSQSLHLCSRRGGFSSTKRTQ